MFARAVGGAVVMRAPSEPPSPLSTGVRRRLRLVGEPDMRQRIARIAIEHLRAFAPALWLERDQYPGAPRTRSECEPCPTCQEWRDARAGGQLEPLVLSCGHSVVEALRHSRPCAFTSCRYNTFLEVWRRNGVLRLNRAPGVEPLDVPPTESCVLDIIDERGALSQEEVADILGVTIEFVRQTERSGEAEARVHGGPALRALLSLWSEQSSSVEDTSHAIAQVTGTIGDIAYDIGGALPQRSSLTEEHQVERWTEHAAALARAGLPLKVAWIRANALEAETMATKTNANKRKLTNGAPITGLPTGAVPREKFTELLPVKVSPEAIAKAGEELAALVADQAALDEKRREANSGFREQQASIKERQKKAAQTVSEGTELRDVECQDFLLPTNEVMAIRLDTGEVVETRTADKDDLQESLKAKAPDDEDDAEDGLEEQGPGAA